MIANDEADESHSETAHYLSNETEHRQFLFDWTQVRFITKLSYKLLTAGQHSVLAANAP